MPPVSRKGDLTTGHCFKPTPPANYCGSVTANGKLIIVKGCLIIPHCCGLVCHDGSYDGSHSVSIEGRSVQCIGDPVTCGDSLAQGSDNVTVDG